MDVGGAPAHALRYETIDEPDDRGVIDGVEQIRRLRHVLEKALEVAVLLGVFAQIGGLDALASVEFGQSPIEGLRLEGFNRQRAAEYPAGFDQALSSISSRSRPCSRAKL